MDDVSGGSDKTRIDNAGSVFVGNQSDDVFMGSGKSNDFKTSPVRDGNWSTVANGGIFGAGYAETGDIVLKKTHNKGKLLAIIVVVVVAVVIVIFLVVVLKGVSGVSLEQSMIDYESLLMNGEKVVGVGIGDVSLTKLMEANDSIYGVARYSDPLSDATVKYYNSLQETVELIEEKSRGDLRLSDALRSQLMYYAGESKELVQYYFVGMALVYTNASYDYYMKNGNLDGFLSDYGYPFTASANSSIDRFIMAIGQLYNLDEVYYDDVANVGCLSDGIDYECLNNLQSNVLDEVSLKRQNYMSIVSAYNNDILELLVSNVDAMKTILEEVTNE